LLLKANTTNWGVFFSPRGRVLAPLLKGEEDVRQRILLLTALMSAFLLTTWVALAGFLLQLIAKATAPNSAN
jgi:hypothetical protein